jgi:hypothetical protein
VPCSLAWSTPNDENSSMRVIRIGCFMAIAHQRAGNLAVPPASSQRHPTGRHLDQSLKLTI